MFPEMTPEMARDRAVWAPVRVQKVSVFSGHEHPCLALRFLPAAPSVLVYLEERSRVHVVDVRDVFHCHQVLRHRGGRLVSGDAGALFLLLFLLRCCFASVCFFASVSVCFFLCLANGMFPVLAN